MERRKRKEEEGEKERGTRKNGGRKGGGRGRRGRKKGRGEEKVKGHQHLFFHQGKKEEFLWKKKTRVRLNENHVENFFVVEFGALGASMSCFVLYH